MLGLLGTDTGCRKVAPPTQVGRASLSIMGIGRQKMNAPLVQHPMSPILRSSAKSSSKRTRRDLHPHPGLNQPSDRIVTFRNPCQPFRMGEDRDKPCHQEAKKELPQMRGGRVVRRFDQNVSRASKREDSSGMQPLYEIWHHVHVCAGHQAKRDAFLIESLL
jgi:hypothetical protein